MVQISSCSSLWCLLMEGWVCLVVKVSLYPRPLEACKTFRSLYLPWSFELMASACYARPEQFWCTSPDWSSLFVVLTTIPFRIGPKGIFFAESSSAPYWTYVGVLSSPTLSVFHERIPSSRKGNAGVSLSVPQCTPAGGYHLLSPRRGYGVGLFWWTSKARDSVGRRLSLYCCIY